VVCAVLALRREDLFQLAQDQLVALRELTLARQFQLRDRLQRGDDRGHGRVILELSTFLVEKKWGVIHVNQDTSAVVRRKRKDLFGRFTSAVRTKRLKLVARFITSSGLERKKERKKERKEGRKGCCFSDRLRTRSSPGKKKYTSGFSSLPSSSDGYWFWWWTRCVP
jgi:hypothetical protein